ncbi:hypothetical protein SAMN00767673_3263 [Rubrobacter radiotolerans DSM 5868]|nr:hypothetical protein SAMN00767673_3263 [Rubrobacter radiotolerans DSM 5868]
MPEVVRARVFAPSEGVGTLSVVCNSMTLSQNGLSSLSIATGLNFIATNELRGSPPHFLLKDRM